MIQWIFKRINHRYIAIYYIKYSKHILFVLGVNVLLLSGTSSYVLISESGFTCTVCGSEFSVQSNCRRHVREKHLGGDQDSCPVCNKIISKRNMQRHVKICAQQKWSSGLLLYCLSVVWNVANIKQIFSFTNIWDNF